MSHVLIYLSDAPTRVLCQTALSLALAFDRKQGVEVVRLIQGEAESIPAPAASFDVVVSTLVLCSVRDPVAVLSEVHRVLRPGGKYCFIEHVGDTHSSQALIPKLLIL
jgi:ubiquinone/menaquinone biosynthesis C-methylase UbiE